MTVSAGARVETIPMLIGGELRGARSGDTLDATNPATGELLARIPRSAGIDVDDAVGAARAAFPGWRATAMAERAALVTALAEVIEREGERLAALDVADNGSPLHEMRKDAAVAAAQLRYFAGVALQLRGQTIPVAHDRLDYTLMQPYGVVGRIIPFNHPFMFAATKIAAPLIAGNTVVLKPSEHTSLSALALAEHLRDLFPPGVVNVVTGLGMEAGDALVAHPDVPRLAFIGSAETGRRIQARAAAVAVKAVTLELGGKNPLVVFDDADVDAAVDGAVGGMNFTWQGQSCGSTSRLLVQRELHGAFVERLAERVEALRSGMPTDPQTDTGAIVNDLQLEKVLRYIGIGREEGARLVAGGTRVTEGDLARGLFVRPTVFDGVDPDGRLAQEEIFGPVLAVIPFDHDADALRIANSVRYGLTASVFTRDLTRAHAFARDVEAGFVWVNDASKHFIGAPFGGVKESGLGREEDFEELVSYTRTKNVNVKLGA
jgi:acyl-CoA reductase-like NAD-dependent aldehyde dehydrogenase